MDTILLTFAFTLKILLGIAGAFFAFAAVLAGVFVVLLAALWLTGRVQVARNKWANRIRSKK